MVKSNGYTPTNKYFRNKFQDFASTKTKKGHLNKSGDDEGTKTLTGVLVKVSKQKMYDNGWLVETTDKKQYWCSYGDGVLCLPDSVESKEYYTPKKNVEVEISVDEDNKIYTITRLKDPNKKPLALYSDTLEISLNTNTDTNKDNSASIQVSQNDISLMGKTIAQAFESNKINVTEELDSANIIANNTVSNVINTNVVKTKEIMLTNDEEPTMVPIGNDVLMVNRQLLTSEMYADKVSGSEINATVIKLGDDDLDTRLKNLERRIEELEGDS